MYFKKLVSESPILHTKYPHPFFLQIIRLAYTLVRSSNVSLTLASYGPAHR